MFHRESGVFKTSYKADMALYPLPIAKWTVAVIAVLFSLVAAYYYLRVVKVMYFDEPADTSPIVAAPEMRVALSVNGISVLVLGIVPQYLLALCAQAMLRTLGG
jgi:NADH-quinone oxidoreductase subunit N